jgi:hypothetical protein
MLDNKQLKGRGLRFGRTLQMSLRTALMFASGHTTVDRLVKTSFDELNRILIENGQFTFGFVDRQVLINNILTSDPGLRQVENEFLKRGIGAIIFDPGLTLKRYERLITLVAKPQKDLEQAGGLRAIFLREPIEGIRLLPAPKNQRRNDDGDTVIDTDSETFLANLNSSHESSRDLLDAVHVLLRAGDLDPDANPGVVASVATITGATQDEVKAGMAIASDGQVATSPPATSTAGAIAAGLALEAGLTASQVALLANSKTGNSPVNGSSHGAAPNGNGQRSPAISNGNGEQPDGNGASYSAASGEAAPESGSNGTAPSNGRGKAGSVSRPGGYLSLMEIMDQCVERALVADNGNPEDAFFALSRILRDFGTQAVLDNFSPERRDELKNVGPETIAAELVTDKVVQLVVQKLEACGQDADKFLVDNEVFRALARSIQATHMADSILKKLHKLVEDQILPERVQQHIQEELRWTALAPPLKQAKLLELECFDRNDFRRLQEHMQDLLKAQLLDEANQVAAHYLETLGLETEKPSMEGVSRLPGLIAITPARSGSFSVKAVALLGAAAARPGVSQFIHFQCVVALLRLSQNIAPFEQFELIETIGRSIEAAEKAVEGSHASCCHDALKNLLPDRAIERVVELCLENSAKREWERIAVTLIRWTGRPGAEQLFIALEKEATASKRLSLMRLIGHVGAVSIEAARARLTDQRWFVARNACRVLSDLRDPELPQHIIPALQHPDGRAQSAAIKALLATRSPDIPSILASALGSLTPENQSAVLEEIRLTRDRAVISALANQLEHGAFKSPNLINTARQILQSATLAT